MQIKIDTKEHNEEMFDAFDILAAEKGFSYEKTHLDVADVVCGNIAIERKEANDFISSIMDQRMKEQTAKMCLNYENRYIIIEGNPFRTTSEINPNAIIGKMTSLAVKYDVKIIFVDTPTHFAYACWSIIFKHMSGQSFNAEEFDTQVFKVDDKDILSRMLYQIPRLGIDKAKLIAEKYNYSLNYFVTGVCKEDLVKLEGVGDVMADRIVKIAGK